MTIKDQLRLNQWAEDMAAWKKSGLTQKTWCEQHNVNTRTFSYRCRIVCEKMQKMLDDSNLPAVTNAPVALPDIAQINVSPESTPSDGITIRLGDMTINISPASSTEHVNS